MERIASFTVDHTVLEPGLYLSRRDGNVVTFDLRFKKPNTGDLLSNSQMHSVEHLHRHPPAQLPKPGRGGLLRPHGLPDGLLLPL